MLRAVGAVMVGYIIIAVLVLATDVAIGMARGTQQTFTIVNLAVALPYAIIGGYIAARIAKRNEALAAIGLTAFSVAMSIVTLLVDRGRQPLWYWGFLLALLATGVLWGGYLRRQQTNRLVT